MKNSFISVSLKLLLILLTNYITNTNNILITNNIILKELFIETQILMFYRNRVYIFIYI